MGLQDHHKEERIDRRKDTAVVAFLERLIETGPEGHRLGVRPQVRTGDADEREGAPSDPHSLGRRSVRAVMRAVAEMYIRGVSTREDEPLCAIGSSTMASAVMREFGIESLSSSTPGMK